MRKFYLLLFFIVLSFGVTKSSIHSRSIYNPYVQTQITKTIFDMKKYRTDWIETYSTKITFDFIDNSKIIIDSYNEKTIFNVKLKKIDIHENSRLYLMKGVDSAIGSMHNAVNNNQAPAQQTVTTRKEVIDMLRSKGATSEQIDAYLQMKGL